MASRELFLTLAMLLWLASWFVRAGYPPWTSFPGEALAFFGLGLLALSAAYTSRQSQSLPPPLIGLFLLLIATTAIQWLTGVGLRGDLLIASAYVMAAGMALLVGMTANNAKHLLTTLAAAHLGGAVLTAITIILQWGMAEGAPFPIPPVPRGWRPAAYFDQPNHAATFLLSGLICAHYLRHIKRMPVTVLWGLIAVLCMGLQLANSRTALLALVLLSAIWFFKAKSIAPDQSRLRTLAPLFATWALLICVRISLAFVLPWLLGLTQMPRGLEADPIRLGLWQQIAAGAMHRFWTGYGWLETAGAQYAGALAHPFQGSVGTNYAHNLLLDLAAWIGIPLALVATTLLVYLGYQWISHARKPYQVFALMVATPFVVHSGLEYPYAYAYLLLPYALYLGIAYTPPQATLSTTNHATQHNRSSKYWLVAGLMTSALTGWTVQHYLTQEEDIRLLRFQDRRIVMKELPNTNHPTPFDQLSLIKQALSGRPRPGMTDTEMSTLVRLRDRYSGAAYQARYITALLLNGSIDNAQTEYQRLVAVHGFAMGKELTQILIEEHGLKPPWSHQATSTEPGR